MSEKLNNKLFWEVTDVMEALHVCRPVAYREMEKSGCLAPLGRRKRVNRERFIAYMSGDGRCDE